MTTENARTGKFKLPTNRKAIRAFVFGAITTIVLEGLKLWLGEGIADLLNKASNQPFYHKYVVPFVIGITPILLTIMVIAYFLSGSSSEESTTGISSNGDDALSDSGSETDKKSAVINEFQNNHNKLKVLHDLGITDVMDDLHGSELHPRACMLRVRKSLKFMGILGSKWIFDQHFIDFINRIQINNGTINFLLIHPEGKSFSKLVILREMNISSNSLDHFFEMCKKYPCLRVKLYEELPIFRLVFVDGKTVGVSRYKLDAKGYFESKKGWDAPHLVLSEGTRWSLYDTFESYFDSVWNHSEDIADYISKPIQQASPSDNS